ncbi:hypothetical protein G6F60_015283 [Rhizopus arrhizus]|nr:hypothetical protein G6F60_015283 [Rhizopus arrhizus]
MGISRSRKAQPVPAWSRPATPPACSRPTSLPRATGRRGAAATPPPATRRCSRSRRPTSARCSWPGSSGPVTCPGSAGVRKPHH